MGYVIGSQKGKDIAKNMKTGETYKASDGSTWTKKSDGSVSVTHNGKTYNNAYTSSSSGGSSSGGSSSKNSQYTGSGYTIGSDYGKQVAQNMGIGESFSATDGSTWTKEKDGTITVKKNGQTYTNVYKPSDLGTLGRQQIDAGLPYQYVESTLYDRLDKIANNPELSQYANDGTYWMMYNYIQDQKNAEEKANYEEVEQDRPDEYESKYDARIDALLSEILNRDGFSYDAMNDPLYQQYANMYRREGDRAMKETLAEAAAGAGGMNTYAITAAQQANSYYGSKLNDMIPELYQAAYDKYLKDIDLKVQDMGLLQSMDDKQYSRYRDTMSDWRNDRNFAYGAYQDAVQQGNWESNRDYNAMLDNRNFNNGEFWKNKEFNYNDIWANKEWDANRGDVEYNRNQTETETAKAEIEWLIQNGVSTINPELITKAGLTQEAVNQMIAYFKQQQAPKVTSSGGGDPKYDPKPKNDNPTAVKDAITKDKSYEYDGVKSGNYDAVFNACEELSANGDDWGAAAYAKEAQDNGLITQEEYNALLKRYNPLLDTFLGSKVVSAIK